MTFSVAGLAPSVQSKHHTKSYIRVYVYYVDQQKVINPAVYSSGFFLRPLLLLLLLLLPNLKSFILRTNDKNECKIAVECWHCYFVMALRATGFIYYSWRSHNFCVKSYTHVRETKVFMQTKCCRFDIMSLIPNRFAMKVFLLTLINEPFFSVSY